MSQDIKMSKEIVVAVPDEIGILSKISNVVSDAGINITAICGYQVENTAHLRLITDRNVEALNLIEAAGYPASEHDVVVSEMSPHCLHPEIANFAEGYDVENNYWCAATHCGEHALLVFSPKDNLKKAGIR